MRLSVPSALTSLLLLATSAPVLAALPHFHRGPTSPKASRSYSRGHATKVTAAHAATPAGIAPARATQIQSALIKSGYMSGEPTGVWDANTQAAMVKMQSDNGWQTKLVPDSRAIIKLGLGPGSTPAAEPSLSEASTPPPESISATNQ